MADPHYTEFLIGFPGERFDTPHHIGVVKRSRFPLGSDLGAGNVADAPLECTVINDGSSPFSIFVDKSPDNDYQVDVDETDPNATGVGDGTDYVAADVHHNGADVASIQVEPGGKVVFTVQDAQFPYHLFRLTDADEAETARGRVQVRYANGLFALAGAAAVGRPLGDEGHLNRSVS